VGGGGGSAAAPHTPRGSVPDWRGIDRDCNVGVSGEAGVDAGRWRREGSFPAEAGKGCYRPPFKSPGKVGTGVPAGICLVGERLAIRSPTPPSLAFGVDGAGLRPACGLVGRGWRPVGGAGSILPAEADRGVAAPL